MAGCGTSYTAQPAPPLAPTITQQPTNQTVAAGGTATFTAAASGNPAPTVQWQVSIDGGTTFSNVSGATSTTLMLSAVTAALNTYQYRAMFTNSVGSVNSNAATLTVTGGPTITSATSATFTVGMATTFTVTATGTPAPTLSESGPLPSGVTFTPATGVLSGAPQAGTGAAYPITFTAHNGAGADVTQNFTLTVNEAPSFASANMTNFTVGASGTFTIIAAGFPAPTFRETGPLPGGVTLTSSTGVLSGTPTMGGTFPIVITAHNGVGADATQNFTLTVDTAPVITSLSSTTFTVGTAGTFTVTATGSPAPTFNETGTLPAGVTLDPATGVLSGTPQVGTGAIYLITFTASNGSGLDATQNFTLTVNEVPSFTSAISTTFTVGASGMFTVTAAGYPAPTLSATGTLPNGVTFSSSTGVLSGTPAAGSAGSYPLTFTASNVVGPNATQNFTLTVNPAPPVIGDTLPTSPIFAGGSAVTITVTVANDVAGDVLTASLTVDSNTGTACTTTTCGTLPGGGLVGPVAFVSLGNYTLSYTPPASLAAQVVPTLVISSSNLSGSFASTDYIEVDPAGVPLVKLSGAGIIQVGSAQSLTATVYNDATGNPGVTFAPLTASGYACSTLATNSCGTLVVGTKTSSGTTTTTPITFTPPTSVPSAPYDRPRIQATSVASPAQLASTSFLISGTAPANTGLRIPTGEKFNSALAATGAAALTVDANIVNDTGNIRTVTWTLTYQQSPGSFVTCPQPTCGTLSTATPTGNGTFVSSKITYTPPSTVPIGTQATPTITATSVDNPSATESFTFTLSDGTCATTGHESVLNGQYAFLLRGGGATAGYTALIGSFTANGIGGITGGLLDANASIGPATGFTILSSGSSYTVGSDNRVCLTLANSGGGVQTFRASLGTLVAGVATQGRIIRSEDNTGRRPRQSGVLMKQDPTSFKAAALNGNYALGLVGVDSSGGRIAGAGVLTADGMGTLSNFSADFDDAGVVSGNATGGSGTYTMATSGRGMATTMLTVLSKPATTNLVLYMVSASDALFMTTDSQIAGKPIESGEMKSQQTGAFLTTTLDSKNYVLYAEGVDSSSGGNDTVIGQATFATNGNATLTTDENNNGTSKTTVSGPANFAIASNGRTTITGSGAGSHPLILYLVDSSSAFIVGADNAVAFGYVEMQVGSRFATSSISGSFFFGGDAPTTGAQYQSGTASFIAPANGGGSINGKADDSGPNGLKTENISGGYSFSISSTPPGKGTVGTNSIAYAISVTKIVFMSTGTDPEIFVGQR